MSNSIILGVRGGEQQCMSYIDIHHFPQRGDSAVIVAAVGCKSDALQELVSRGANLNLQNQVRYTVTVDTALYHVSLHIRRV